MLKIFFLRTILSGLFLLVSVTIGWVLQAPVASATSVTYVEPAMHMDSMAYSEPAMYPASAPQGHVTVIIEDMSGSMTTNDGDGVRCSAANAYIDLSGPGDEIGVIGLDNPPPSPTNGKYGFGEALLWANPSSMDTTAQRAALKQLIATKSHNCVPDGSTPTYDALAKALPMLSSATSDGKSGSVILLTDGQPQPNENDAQVKAINKDLRPQFVAHHWPIDTIALGADTSQFDFLRNLSDRTGGRFYSDDINGQVSALNIADFFVAIFHIRNNRTLGPFVPREKLPGGSVKRDIELGPYVDHLDVIAIKDQAATMVTLTAPGPHGETLSPQMLGTFVSTGDPHYAMFSINQPPQGTWQLNINGSGQFEVDSLVTSSLTVAISSPKETPTLPLGQSFTVSASIETAQGTPPGDLGLTLQCTIINNHGYKSAPRLLQYDARSGQYVATLSVPISEAPGSYEIDISASQVSRSVSLAEAHRVIQMDLFPQPQLNATNGVAVRWDPALTAIYSLPIGFIRWLGQFPLRGLPTIPSALLGGQVTLKGQPYSDATVSATVRPVGAKDDIQAYVTNLSKGHFTVQIPALQGSDYIVTFRTSGSFKDNTGDFGLTAIPVHVNIRPATPSQEIFAWIVTAVYVVLLLFILGFLLNLLKGEPQGKRKKVGRSLHRLRP